MQSLKYLLKTDTKRCLLYNINKACTLKLLPPAKTQCKKCKKNPETKCNKTLTITILGKNKNFVLKTVFHFEGVTFAGFVKGAEFPSCSLAP